MGAEDYFLGYFSGNEVYEQWKYQIVCYMENRTQSEVILAQTKPYGIFSPSVQGTEPHYMPGFVADTERKPMSKKFVYL